MENWMVKFSWMWESKDMLLLIGYEKVVVIRVNVPAVKWMEFLSRWNDCHGCTIVAPVWRAKRPVVALELMNVCCT